MITSETGALLARWQCTWRDLGATGADEVLFRKVVAGYAEPHRHYHTLQHLEECFALLDSVRSAAQPRVEHPAQVELALWFHDAIYRTNRKDNEERSAQWARDSVLSRGLPSEVAARAFDLVMCTRHNVSPAGCDAQILVDIDLAVLGAQPARFDEYERQIREEYSWVPEFLYRKERRRILEEFASRPAIYHTEHFRNLYEARARDNIARSLARLSNE